MATSDWLTSEEAAQYLKVERRTLLAWVRDGKAPAYQLSGTKRHCWRFRQHDLDAMLTPSSADSARGREQ
jgi:excisionase family DNA binding protein